MFLRRFAGNITCRLRRHHSQTSNSKHIRKVLVANRGEIACRIIRTARKLGIQTVAVYSDADKNSLHTSLADEAYHIGESPSQKSYLDKSKILKVAELSQSHAIHPGYGFLSENVEFADLCEKNGIIFIGPPSSAIRDMGIKSTSKAIMSAADVPIIEGYHGDEQSDARLLAEAERIGFPVMIKAVRGGGGKGMRLAYRKEDFHEELTSARTEATKSFGDDIMLVEKFVETPRHVEVQVFGDHHGNYVYLFERDCSVQRRHQKIIEEAPAPGISEDTRRAIGEAAVRAARAVNYVGAGTVEFIMDQKEQFYFMEMNTRLQVEHPITEMITNTDLVEWQLLAASGKPLPVSQKDLAVNGHAFEARIYAEDPSNNFLPGAGPLLHLSTPLPSNNVRIDTGVRQGDEVSVFYDPMIAKLVVWSHDRETALRKLRASLSQYNIVGLTTNVPFLDALAAHPSFASGHVHTGFIEQHGGDLFRDVTPEVKVTVRAVLALLLAEKENVWDAAILTNDPYSPFGMANSMRLNHNYERIFKMKQGKKDIQVHVIFNSNDTFAITIEDEVYDVRGELNFDPEANKTKLRSEINGVCDVSNVYMDGVNVHVFGNDGSHAELSLTQPKFVSESTGSEQGSGAIAPMPGTVEKILVAPGDRVEQGQPVAVMIAMKMEYVIRAPHDGVISSVPHNQGATVKKGTPLVVIEENK